MYRHMPMDCSKIMGYMCNQLLLVLQFLLPICCSSRHWNLVLVTYTSSTLILVHDPPTIFELKDLTNVLNVFLAHLPLLWASETKSWHSGLHNI